MEVTAFLLHLGSLVSGTFKYISHLTAALIPAATAETVAVVVIITTEQNIPTVVPVL